MPPSGRANLFHWIDATQRIGNMGEGKQPNRVLAQSLIQERPIDAPFVSLDRNVLKRSARPPRGHLPWNQIGMMLHLGDQNDIAWSKMGVSPGTGDQIDPFGCSAGKDDRFAGSCAQKSGGARCARFRKDLSHESLGRECPGEHWHDLRDNTGRFHRSRSSDVVSRPHCPGRRVETHSPSDPESGNLLGIRGLRDRSPQRIFHPPAPCMQLRQVVGK